MTKRSFSWLLSLLVIATMVVVACGGEEATDTPKPEPTEAPMATEAPQPTAAPPTGGNLEIFRTLPLSAETQAAILYENAERVFGL